jgi:hypothetical protein
MHVSLVSLTYALLWLTWTVCLCEQKAAIPRRSSQSELVRKTSTARLSQKNGLRNNIQVSESQTRCVHDSE